MKCIHPHWTSRDIINSVTNKLSLARAMTASSAWHSAAFAPKDLPEYQGVQTQATAVFFFSWADSFTALKTWQVSCALDSVCFTACFMKTKQTITLNIWTHLNRYFWGSKLVQDLVRNWQCGLRLRQMLALDLNTLAFSDCLSAEIILKYERRM